MNDFKKAKEKISLHENIKDYMYTKEEIKMRKQIIDTITGFVLLGVVVIFLWMLVILSLVFKVI